MNRSARLRSCAALLAIVAAVAATSAAPQPAPTQDEIKISPYLLLHGPRGHDERADRHEYLARVAEAAGDQARAARHLGIACFARSELILDVSLGAPACKRARALARDHHVVDVEVALLTHEGTLRAWSLDVTGAIARVQEALTLGAALDPDLPDSLPVNGAHFTLGAILIEAGQFDFALRELTFARAHCGTAGNLVCTGFADVWLCRLHTQLGDFGAARAACDAAQAAANRDQFVLMNLEWIRGDLEAALGRHGASLAALRRSWQAARIRGGELLWGTLMHSIADELVALGRIDEAEVYQQQLEEATARGLLPASYGPQTALRRGELAMARGKLDEAIAAFVIASGSPMHSMSINGDYALANARRARRDLAGSRAALERAIAKIEAGRTSVGGAALRASYQTLHTKAYGELIGVRWDTDGAASAPAALEIAEAGRARALLDALGSAQVAGAAAPTLSATAVQATLGAGEVLVEYVSSENRLLALTVTRDRIAFNALPGAGTAAELGQRVDFFSALVQESDEAALGPVARRLYADILAPALAEIPATARTLIIAADGPLHRLPFDALGEGPRVIDRWNVVTLPSASALANRVRRATPSATALVVAAPVNAGRLGELPAAAAEAAAIHHRLDGEIAELSGSGATEARLEALGLGRFAVLHFASHAVVDAAMPLRSALMLTPGAPGVDGRWSAEEIYRTTLAADLVVLSACSTGAGTQAPGEGVMSLARAFLYAGAGATVATLWDVPDAPGPIFADVLYRELADGRPLGAAVADARRELRRRGAPPRAWAAYVLTGNPGAIVGVTARVDPWAVTARFAGVAAVVLLLAAAAMRFARVRWRLWPAPAMAAVGMAIVAIVLQPWPARYPSGDARSLSDRGGALVALTPTVDGGRLTWSPVANADEHIVEIYDDAGLAVGSPLAATSPFVLPVAARGGWIRVEARDHGQPLARSTLIRLK